MFANITTYLNAVARLWHAQDGTLVAQLISLRDRHATNAPLQIEFPESMVGRTLDAPIDDIVVEHIKVLYYLSRSRKQHLFHFILLDLTLLLCNRLIQYSSG